MAENGNGDKELTRREILEMARDRIGAAIVYGGTETKDLAGLSREMRLLLAELDALPEEKVIPKVGSPDEIAAKRAARLRSA